MFKYQSKVVLMKPKCYTGQLTNSEYFGKRQEKQRALVEGVFYNGDFENRYGRGTICLYKNPSFSQVGEWLKTKELRFVCTDDDDIFVWDATTATHVPVIYEFLSLPTVSLCGLFTSDCVVIDEAYYRKNYDYSQIEEYFNRVYKLDAVPVCSAKNYYNKLNEFMILSGVEPINEMEIFEW